jgi:preprotein translocase subunit SecG
MYIALIILILLVCFLLALVVLAQNPKGGGLSSQFGAGGAANLMGVKRTGDLLEKLTWGFAIGLVVLSLGTHMLNGTSGAAPARSMSQQKALETKIPAPAAPVAPAPAAPAPAGAPAGTPAPATTPGN